MNQDSNSKPKISVIVPVYGVEAYLDRCVQSIMNQTLRDIEIILVDDGGKDNCPAMCDAYQKQDPRIQVIHKKNGGLSDARNAGLKRAVGEYAFFVDADDYLSPDACEECMKAIEKGADVITYTFVTVTETDEHANDHACFEDLEVLSARDYSIRAIRSDCFYTVVFSFLYRREFLTENHLYFRAGWNFEDWDLIPRLFTKDFRIAIVRHPVYYYVKRENSITTSPVTPKKIHDSVGALMRWQKAFEKIEDPELKRCFRHLLTNTYIWNCDQLGLGGWWIRGVNFFSGLRCGIGRSTKRTVLRFEASSIAARFTGKRKFPDKELLGKMNQPMLK